ncbi:MAG: tetratricopeptide repeat protein [Anaerolineae bacterium]
MTIAYKRVIGMIELHNEVKGVFQRRHRHIVETMLRQLAPLTEQVQSTNAAAVLAELDEDLGTLTDTLSTLTANPGDLLDRLCEVLRVFSPYFDLRGLTEEQMDWAQNLLRYFRDHAQSEDDAVDLSLILIIANMMQRLGEHEDAIELYEFVLSIDRHRSTHPGFAVAYHNMALVYLGIGDDARGMEACQRALEIDQHNENERGIAANLMLLADFQDSLGQVRASGETMKQALAILERIDNRVLMTTFKGKVAAFTAKYGETPKADALFLEALADWKAMGDDEQYAIVQFNYAVVLHETGRPEEAMRRAAESLKLPEADRHYVADHIRAAMLAGQTAKKHRPRDSLQPEAKTCSV